MTETLARPVPMSGAIAFAEDGSPYLAGQQCTTCGEVMPGHRIACARCFSSGTLQPCALGSVGMIFAWTIVHRSFPGVPVPLVSATVRLESGAHLRGNVEGLAPDPDAVAACGPVAVHFDTIAAPDGTPVIRYLFRPVEA